jgi:hypothetical protein
LASDRVGIQIASEFFMVIIFCAMIASLLTLGESKKIERGGEIVPDSSGGAYYDFAN